VIALGFETGRELSAELSLSDELLNNMMSVCVSLLKLMLLDLIEGVSSGWVRSCLGGG